MQSLAKELDWHTATVLTLELAYIHIPKHTLFMVLVSVNINIGLNPLFKLALKSLKFLNASQAGWDGIPHNS